jgi:hypothetical protein
MAKYSDLLSQAMGVSSEKIKGTNSNKQGVAVSVPITSPDAVMNKSYEPFSEESEMESYEDSGAEDGSGNQTNIDMGATTGNDEDAELDDLIRLKLEALSRVK